MSGNEKKYFISYSHEDRDFASKLADRLSAGGVDVWRDERGIDAGSDWADEIEDALTECSSVIVILSPAARQSRWVKNEITYACQKKKEVIPVIARACPIPLQLITMQAVDFTGDETSAWEKLEKALENGQVPEPPCFFEDMVEFLEQASPRLTRHFIAASTGSAFKAWSGSLLLSPRHAYSAFILFAVPSLVVMAVFYLVVLFSDPVPLPSGELMAELGGFAALVAIGFLGGLAIKRSVYRKMTNLFLIDLPRRPPGEWRENRLVSRWGSLEPLIRHFSTLRFDEWEEYGRRERLDEDLKQALMTSLLVLLLLTIALWGEESAFGPLYKQFTSVPGR
jgi:hypothetical protein